MIHGVFGKLGAGKGLLVMDLIGRELIDGFRDIVTNVPLRLIPWVNGQGIPQIGLRAYLLEKLYPMCEEDVDDILKRILVIEDIDRGADMYLWRRDGDTGEWFKLEISKVDDKGRPERFDAEPIKTRHCQPIMCVSDEAWQFYPNSGGWSRTPVLTFYSKQQRKLRDEWFIVTQHPTDVDASLWNIAQDFWVCRNHGMERMGIFRQPSMFRVIVYLTNPAKGNAQRSHEFYRRLDKKLSQCYDTTAGVGIAGGFKGDSNQKKPGLHIAWLFVGILILVGLLCTVPHFMGKMAGAWIHHTVMTPGKPENWAGLKTNNISHSDRQARNGPVATQDAGIMSKTDPGEVSRNDEPEVTCTGYTILDGKPIVFFSDGTTAEGGEVQKITTHEVRCFGKTFRIHPPKAVTPPSPASSFAGQFNPYASPNQGETETPDEPDTYKPVNDAIILPSIHSQTYDWQPPPRINGISKMQQSLGSSQLDLNSH